MTFAGFWPRAGHGARRPGGAIALSCCCSHGWGFGRGEIVRLELDDIDWSRGWLTVHGKGRQERPLPLPHDVGEALASYLKDGRPESACRRVFLRSRAPFDGLGSHSDICQIVHRAIGRAGIKVKVTGAHQLRHALARGHAAARDCR